MTKGPWSVTRIEGTNPATQTIYFTSTNPSPLERQLWRVKFDGTGLERITTDAEVEHAVHEPPADTRAFFRGRCLSRWPESIVAANWDSLVFDVGGDPLRRVPMMEPLRGTQAHVGSLIDDSNTAAELLEKLGQ